MLMEEILHQVDVCETLENNQIQYLPNQLVQEFVHPLRIIGPSKKEGFESVKQGSGISKPPVLRSHDS